MDICSDIFRQQKISEKSDSEKQNSKILKQAYKKLLISHHPDKNRDDKFAEEKFREIQLAYDTLKDAKLRNEYDTIWTNFCNLYKYKQIRFEIDVERKSGQVGVNDGAVSKMLDYTSYSQRINPETLTTRQKLTILFTEYFIYAEKPTSLLISFLVHIFTNIIVVLVYFDFVNKLLDIIRR